MSLLDPRRLGNRRDEVALRDADTTLTWAELDRTLNRSVGALLARDLGPERRVAVFAENSAQTVIAYVTAILAGASAVPVNHRFTAGELAYILEDSGARHLFAGPATAAVAREAIAHLDVELFAWDGGRTAPEPRTDLRPRPFLHYTSGTTGRPKGAETPPGLFAGGDTVAEHADAVMRSARGDGGPVLVVCPLHHGGPSRAVQSLIAGRPLVVLRRFDAEATLAAIERHRVTSTFMVPTQFIRLLGLPAATRRRYDVSSLQTVIHAGAPCPVNVKRRMIEWLGPVLYEIYGAVEAGSTNAIDSHEWLERPGSVGRTLPPFEVLVVDDEGAELPPNRPGRLYYRDATGRGVVFHNDPVKTADAHLRPGVFTMGEIGYVDDDGYVFITDRASDLVISGGVNVYPAEAESVIRELGGVADAACIGVPDEDLGEVLKALVVPADWHALPDPDELLAGCRRRLAKYKCPRVVEFVPDVGRTALGKVNKRDLRARYSAVQS
jgi:long-chain acyl-CoA synthetase